MTEIYKTIRPGHLFQTNRTGDGPDYSFDYSKRTRHKSTQPKTDLFIKGRPLTAYSVYSSKKKINNKKASKIL